MAWLVIGLLVLIFLALTGGGHIARRIMSFLWGLALLIFVAIASGNPIFVFKGYIAALTVSVLIAALLFIRYRSRNGGVVNGPSDKQ